MPLEIKLLVWSAALAAVQTAIAAFGTVTQAGLPAGVGNRENMQPFSGWVGRAHRAHRNLLESLVLFAILVLVAQAFSRFNAMTALGAQLFFYSRVLYAVVYIAGIPWVRTLIWSVSIVGLVMIFLQLM
jgi:uncharacterized MAPEG superfamily protein